MNGYTLDWMHIYRRQKLEDRVRDFLKMRGRPAPERLFAGICHGLGFTVSIDFNGHTEVGLSAAPGLIVTDESARLFFRRCAMTPVGDPPLENAAVRTWIVKPEVKQ